MKKFSLGYFLKKVNLKRTKPEHFDQFFLIYKGANIQLLDLPGIIEGASQGKGRGRQVIAVARTADLVLMMLDATKPNVHRDLLERELESVGIRLNKRKPQIYFKIKKGGGWFSKVYVF